MDKVKKTYKLMHTHQTVDFCKAKVCTWCIGQMVDAVTKRWIFWGGGGDAGPKK